MQNYNELYGVNDFRNYELYHHGILGMKWGRRNGPPYPLDVGDHSASEKKAGYRDSIGMRKGSRNEDRYAYTGSENHSQNDKDAIRKYIKQIDKKSFEERRKEITKSDRDSYRREMIKRGTDSDFYRNASDKEIDDDIEKKQKIKKAIIIGAAAAGIGVAIYFAYKGGVLENVAEQLKGNVSDKERLAKIYEKAKTLSSEDIGVVLDKNTVLHRVHGYQDLDLNKVNGPLYAAYKPVDVNIYKGFFAGKAQDRGKQTYDVALGLKNNIITPSRQKTEQIVTDLYKNDKKFYKDIAATIVEFTNPNMDHNSKEFKDHVKEMIDTLQMSDDDYRFQEAMWSIVRGGNASKKIQKAVEKEGFTAMIDYFDAGGFSETPLIFFEGKHELINLGSEFIDTAAAENARKYVREHIEELPRNLMIRWA